MTPKDTLGNLQDSTSDPRWELAQRVAQSRTFARSARLPQFLLYVCERSLAGGTDELSEQHIGVQVFGRPPDYSSGEDNIVRAQARLLRKKLDEYFEVEGREEALRIRIPKGGYAPTFEAQVAPAVLPGSDLPADPPRSSRSSRLPWFLLAAALLAAILWTLAPRWTSRTPDSDFAQFWSTIFNAQRATFLVPSDTALVLYQRLANRELTLSEYINRQFDPVPGFQATGDPRLPESVARARYTNMPDIELCWRLARTPGFELANTTLRYARELRISDLKDSNAILLGARRANPWVELFQARLNFQPLFDAAQRRDHIVNRNPTGKEQATYIDHERDGQRWSYSVVAFIAGLNDQGHALLVGGTTSAGTEGAIDFVMNENRFGGFLRSIKKGDKIPHFEILLHTGNVAGSARQTELIGQRIY
jgi:hypothetical protein